VKNEQQAAQQGRSQRTARRTFRWIKSKRAKGIRKEQQANE